jgi:hypothetical protein
MKVISEDYVYLQLPHRKKAAGAMGEALEGSWARRQKSVIYNPKPAARGPAPGWRLQPGCMGCCVIRPLPFTRQAFYQRFCAPPGIRTRNLRIKSPLLCR